ncbi:MAG: hypothetical protein LBB85_11665 [Dysgonamonadaceae bacterium]|jgi:hypothetical protein|nr:hypothetical protein [Dysgonamonadaceae bacterium]
MARKIGEIKKEITGRFMSEAVVAERYGFDVGSSFDSVFSSISMESIVFFVVAACIWTAEVLFDLHRKEVVDMIDELKPHSLRWYVSKAKDYMLGYLLVSDADYYDTSRMSDEDLSAARVIKYAAAVERLSVVYLKIAGEPYGEPAPVDAEVLAGFTEYIHEVKDAGVAIEVVNEPAEHFRIRMDVYYHPMALNSQGQSFATGAYPVQESIRAFIKNLPFNGEYKNVALIDVLQQIEGVVIPEILLAETSVDGLSWEAVAAKASPWSGYYKIYDESDLNLRFIPYESI